MRILIISFYFPPYNSVASIRVGKMAKYLKKFGHEIKVISAQNDKNLFHLDLEIPAEDVTYTPWIKVSPEGFNTNIREMVSGSNGLYNFARQCWRYFKSFVYFPDIFIGWIPYVKKAAETKLGDWKPDIILVSAAPYSSLFAASRIASKLKVPWVVDFRDLWTDNHCYPFGGIRKLIEGKIENKLLAKAAGLVTVSDPLAEKLRLRFKGPVETICNGFDPDDYSLYEGPSNKSDSKALNIVYMGTIYDDFQDPSPLFLALKKFDKGEVQVSFYGTLSFRLRSLVKKMQVEDRVVFHETIAYIQSLNVQKNADILLLLLWTDIKEQGVFTGKFFEYLGAGRPILAVGPDSGVAAQLINDRKLGVILNSSEAVYPQLKAWLDQKKKKGYVDSIPLQSRQGFSREDQARKLEKFILRIHETKAI